MLVLVDKPVIQYGVEEAVQSGVDNIIIVTGRGKLLELTRHVDAAVGERGADGVDVVSEIGGIDHGQACRSLIVQQRLPTDAPTREGGVLR